MRSLQVLMDVSGLILELEKRGFERKETIRLDEHEWAVYAQRGAQEQRLAFVGGRYHDSVFYATVPSGHAPPTHLQFINFYERSFNPSIKPALALAGGTAALGMVAGGLISKALTGDAELGVALGAYAFIFPGLHIGSLPQIRRNKFSKTYGLEAVVSQHKDGWMTQPV